MKEIFNNRYDSILGMEKAVAWTESGIEEHSLKESDPDFEALYSKEDIQKDAQFVAKRKKNFADMNKEGRLLKLKMAQVLEYIIFEQSELSEWFGPNALTIKTSEFDDIVNGVDMVIEFEDPLEHEAESFDRLGTAVDVSFGTDLRGKFERIVQEIESGLLSEVKYFKSERSKPQKLEHLPRIVIGCAPETIEELVKLWTMGDKTTLGQHPIQVQLLHEIVDQLKVFEEYARFVVKNEKTANTYQNLKEIVANLLAEKKKEFGDVRSQYDSGFQHITDGLSLMRTKIDVAKPKVDPEERLRQIREKHSYLNKKKNAA